MELDAFQPILIDRNGDRGEYFGQQVNGEGDGSNGAVNDPNRNGRADPAFSLDGATIVYSHALVSTPACGGDNPPQCPKLTAQGGREYRVMLAKLKDREAVEPKSIYKVPDYLPWATPFKSGSLPPSTLNVPSGNYTLLGKVSGQAQARFFGDARINHQSARGELHWYPDDEGIVLNGYEDVTVSVKQSKM